MRQPKSTHEKYNAPLVAKQIYITHKVYAKWSICIFTEEKIHTLVSSKYIQVCLALIIMSNYKVKYNTLFINIFL